VNGGHLESLRVHIRGCSMEPSDTLVGARSRISGKKRSSEIELLARDSHAHGNPLRMRATWESPSGAQSGHAWVCRRAFLHLVEDARKSMADIRPGTGNNWKKVDGDRWQGFIVLREGLALYELVSWALLPFEVEGYKLRREQYMILWGKGKTQLPHIDGHFVKPDRATPHQVDDAISVLLYLSDREVSLCMHEQEIRLQVHAGDALVISSRTWHRGIGSDTESGVLFLSLDRSLEANKESDSEFYIQAPNLSEIPKEYVLHMHAGSIWNGLPSLLKSTLKR
jgi:hypothetical protein